MLGVRQTTNFIEKATWTLAALLVVFSVATSFFAKSSAQDPSDVITNMPTTTVPTTPANGQQTPAQQQLLLHKANKHPLPVSKPQ